jgi:hypothetical protein
MCMLYVLLYLPKYATLSDTSLTCQHLYYVLVYERGYPFRIVLTVNKLYHKAVFISYT